VAFHEIEWYDRNPVSSVIHYAGAGVGPHGTTTRWTYTVPPNKKAYVELMLVEIVRRTAAGAVATYGCYIRFLQTGVTVTIMKVESRDNNVDAEKHRVLGQSITLHEGDSLRAQTVDLSTGGVVDYQATVKFTEFDAYLYHAAPKTRPVPLVNVQSAKPRPDPVM